MRIWILVAASLCGPAKASAQSHPCAIGKVHAGTILSGGGLSGFVLPGVDGRFALADIVLMVPESQVPPPVGQVRLHVLATGPDRYGRNRAHVFDRVGWLQGRLLKSGLALARPDTKLKKCRATLLDAERQFKAKNRNYWRSKGIEFEAEEVSLLAENLGQFVLVNGRVRSIGNRQRRLYLNFGENWAHDFTVSVAKDRQGNLSDGLSGLIETEGKKVQVRGVLDFHNGPLIRVTDEAQVQIID